MFALEGVNLSLRRQFGRRCQSWRLRRGSGARGLRSILEGILLDTMFELPEQTGFTRVVIDKDVVAGTKDPVDIREVKENSLTITRTRSHDHQRVCFRPHF
jgi:ATP-dependent Clp protease ATP-binding subunit ClpX